MPCYVYTDGAGHEQELTHSMSDDTQRVCPFCGSIMWRVPQVAAVNWNGLPPHLESARSPAIQDMIDGADRRREEYLATKDTNPFNSERPELKK